MLNVFEAGEESFRLCDRHDEEIGWIRPGALGFDGFATEAEAVAAAEAGSAAFAGWLARTTGAIGVKARSGGRVRLVRDGDDEWVRRGDAPLARLHRPDDEHPLRRRRDSFGVEFVLPSYVKPGSAIGASQVVHNAILRAAAGGAAPAVPAARTAVAGAPPPAA